MICNECNCDSTTVVCMGDFHIGNINTDTTALKAAIKDVEKNGYHLIVLGDLCEAITHTDKRFDMGTIDQKFLGSDMVGKQYDYVEKLLSPVADRILMIHTGNHDQKIATNCEVDMVSDLCKNLDVKYAGYTALSRLSYNTKGHSFAYKLYSTHGYASGRQKGGKVNAIESLAGHIEFDIALAGHSHDLFILNRQKMYQTKYGNLAFKTLFFGNTGSFLKGITEGESISYAERAGYRPLPIGYLKMELDPYKYDVQMQEVIM